MTLAETGVVEHGSDPFLRCFVSFQPFANWSKSSKKMFYNKCQTIELNLVKPSSGSKTDQVPIFQLTILHWFANEITRARCPPNSWSREPQNWLEVASCGVRLAKICRCWISRVCWGWHTNYLEKKLPGRGLVALSFQLICGVLIETAMSTN